MTTTPTEAEILRGPEHKYDSAGFAFGLLVVKPHAVREGLADEIEALIRTPASESPLEFAHPEITIPTLGTVEFCRLAPVSLDHADPFIRVSYADAADQKHYPTLLREYAGETVVFLCIGRADPDDLAIALSDLKGAVGIMDGEGGYKRRPFGIRGAVLPDVTGQPYVVDDPGNEELFFVKFLSNVVHSTDATHLEEMRALYGRLLELSTDYESKLMLAACLQTMEMKNG